VFGLSKEFEKESKLIDLRWIFFFVEWQCIWIERGFEGKRYCLD